MAETSEFSQRIPKVVQLGIQDRVFEAIRTHKPISRLAEELHAEGINITAQSISKFIDTNKHAVRTELKTDLASLNDYKKVMMEYDKEIKDIFEDVKSMKEQARDEKDYQAYSNLVGRLLQGIELFAKIYGDIKPTGSTEINIIYQDVAKEVEKELKNRDATDFVDEEIIDVDYIVNEDTEKFADEIRK